VTPEGIRRALEVAQQLDFEEEGERRRRRRTGKDDDDKKEKKKRRARIPAAVLVVSPSYFGACCSDTSLLAAACCCCPGDQDIPLIVDQAHGAHFGLDGRFPACAAAAAAAGGFQEEEEEEGKTSRCSAPMVVISVASAHKTLDALGQAALLHSSGGVSRELQREVDRALGLLQTSSPSYLLLASLDAARAAGVVVAGNGVGVEKNGGDDGNSFNPWDEPLLAASVAAEAVRSTPGAHLLSDELRELKWDPLRLTVRLEGVGGRALAAALEGNESDDKNDDDDDDDNGSSGSESSSSGSGSSSAVVEMATSKAVVLALGAGSTVEHARAFGRALERVARRRAREDERGRVGGDPAAAVASFSSSSSRPPNSSSSSTELVPLRASLGRLAAGILAPYPPGIPLVHEGEALTAAALRVAAEAWEAGSSVVGLFGGEEEEEESKEEGGGGGGETGRRRRRGEPFVRVLASN